MTLTAFDRQVRDQLLSTTGPGVLAQDLVVAMGLELTEANLAKVLRSLRRLSAWATLKAQEAHR